MLTRLARRLNRGPAPRSTSQDFLDEIGDWERELVNRVRPFTMTTPQRMVALTEAVTYIVRRGIPGALVECGVWRGGSALTMVLTLQRLGITDRDIYLYDTFEGMTKPTDFDVSDFGAPALKEWETFKRSGDTAWPHWFNEETFNIDLVKGLLADTGYPQERLHFVQGPVEETIPGTIPSDIALLRLDTDWYESTHHELVHLYPRTSAGGVVVIDDYGHWKGCRKAVDEYFGGAETPTLLLNRVDYSCRIAVKA